MQSRDVVCKVASDARRLILFLKYDTMPVSEATMCELIKLQKKYKAKKKKVPSAEWKEAATMDIEKIQREVREIKSTMVSKDDLNKAVLQLRPIKDKAAKFDLLMSFFTPWWKGTIVIGFLLFLAAMAGQNIMQITGLMSAAQPIIGG